MGDRRANRRMSMASLGKVDTNVKRQNRRGSVASTSSDELNKLVSLQRKSTKDDEARAMEKEQSLAWKILTNSQVHTLMGLEVEEVEKSLSEMLTVPSYTTDLKEATLLDYYTSAFWWAKEEGFDAQQISGFFTVVSTLMANVKDNMTAAENLAELRKMMVGVGTNVDEANGGLDFLTLKQAKLISSFLETTLFQHYSLYHFLHHGEREEQIVCTDLCVETLPPAAMPYPAPLDEGVDEAAYLKHIAPPPQEMKEEEVGDEKIDEKVVEIAGDPQNDKEVEGDETKDVLAGVTVEEVQTVFDKVAKEMFAGLQDEIALKLKEREADIITRINRIHRIAET
ncbi:ciliary-associated calcium-binding coiled-coil protein 1 isoform X3 [Strongylocentrotus purpuratus]|nr:ciliary-associated calcium-binding coiled-coil protein 1 isoform X3 [Strongylocentrotus purpuratus]